MNAVLATVAGVIVVAGAWAAQPTLPARRLTDLPARTSPRSGRRSGRRLSHRLGHRLSHRWLRVSAPVVGALVVGGPVLSGAVLVGVLAWPRVSKLRTDRRLRRQIARELPDAIDIFVLAVGAGLTPRHAIEQLAQRAPTSVRPAFAAVVARLSRGGVLADALRELDTHLGPPATALSTLVASADRRGLPLAAVLERLAAESRATRRRLDEAAARALPVKLSFPLVVCTLPSFVLLAIVPAVLAALSSLGADAW